jgi:hypothetical protein
MNGIIGTIRVVLWMFSPREAIRMLWDMLTYNRF